MLIENEDNPGSVVEDPAASSTATTDTPAAGAAAEKTTEQTLAELQEQVSNLADQNRGLVRDLQSERSRRKQALRQDLASASETVLEFSAEDKKTLGDLLEKDSVGGVAAIAQRVLTFEWNKYETHQACVTDLMQEHPDMFDKHGRYLPTSEKGKLWEQIATQHPEYKKHPQGVRLALEDLNEMLEASGGRAKGKAADEDPGETEEQRKARLDKTHAGDGGRKPAPKKEAGRLSPEEDAQRVRAKMTVKEWNDHKTNKVVTADV